MVKVGKWIAKHRLFILLIGLLLLIPAGIGSIKTKVNYDLLSYLPSTLETVKGQDLLVEDYGMGAFSMVVVENMELKDVQKLEEKFSKVPHVKDVLWYDDAADISMPPSMIPKKIRKNFFEGDATMMIVLFDDTTSSDASMEAVVEMRKIANKQCFISGMSGVVNDIKDIALREMPIYIVIAAVLSLLVLEVATDSFLVPVLFLLSIGIAILYNLGTNIFLGQVSYITKALSAVLQLGVTMDYSIFLLNSYEENKVRFPEDKNRAMGHAISNTFKAILGSSVTTVAGFAALCFMTFTLGRDLGIVMMKGVIIGVICCVTILPSLILVFDRGIEKTHHKPLVKSLSRSSNFIIKHYKAWIVLFLIILGPALYGNSHTGIYYDIAGSIPQKLPCNVATKKVSETFNMSNMHMVMFDKDMDSQQKRKMLDEMKDIKGVKWTISIDSMVGPLIPDFIIPQDIKDMLQSKDSELAFICSEYKSATKEVNTQIASIDKIAKKYDKSSLVIGEAPLMKDLEDVTDIDLRNVNVASIAAIFIIIMIVFKSVSIPILLVAVIEFAIAVNMSIPYYQGVSLPFVASIVIGTIQLGATVDYAIVLTNRYVKERKLGKSKMEAIKIAHSVNMPSIITSGLSLFAATFGVSCYSCADMVASICTLLARGSIISMIVVVTMLPALFIIFDKLICKTTLGMGDIVKKEKQHKAALV